MSNRGYYTSAQVAKNVNSYQASDIYGSDSHRGVLTIIGKPNKRHFEKRKTGDNSRKYPVGDRTTFDVQEDEAVFTWYPSRGKGTTEAIDFFGSVNGLSWEDCKTIEQLEDKMGFLGTTRSEFQMTDDPSTGTMVDETGCTIQTFGTTNFRTIWQCQIYPGDRIVWRLPRSDDVRMMLSGRSSSREPQGKIRACFDVLDWTGVKYMLNNVAQIVLRRANDIGISHHLGHRASSYDSRRAQSSYSCYLRCAAALKNHQLVTVVKGIEVLHQRGIVTINDPWTAKRKEAKRNLFKYMLESVVRVNVSGTAAVPAGTDPKLAELYGKYSEAMSDRRTDVVRGHTVGDVAEARFSRPYAYFTKGMNFVNRGEVSDYTDSTRPDDVVGALQSEQLWKVNQTLWLGKVLGVVDAPYGGTSANEGIEPVVHDVLNATMMAYTQPENKRMYMPGSGMETTALSRVMDENKALKSALAKFLSVSIGHMEQFSEALNILTDREISKHVVGTAYSYAAPNKMDVKVDVLLGKK